MKETLPDYLIRDKVLIIDDEIEICLLLSNMLNAKGYKTDVAHTLKDGARKVALVNPHLVILDVNLPDGEGFELVPEIREKTEANIILITARDGQRELDLAQELKIEAFLRKPFFKKAILDIVEKYTQVS